MRHSSRIPIIDIKKYGGKQVAVVNGKIIASGPTLHEVIYRAQKKLPQHPLNEIKIFSVPKGLSVIYHV